MCIQHMDVCGVLQCGAVWCSALHVLQCVAVSTAVQIKRFKRYMYIQHMDVCSFVRIYIYIYIYCRTLQHTATYYFTTNSAMGWLWLVGSIKL